MKSPISVNPTGGAPVVTDPAPAAVTPIAAEPASPGPVATSSPQPDPAPLTEGNAPVVEAAPAAAAEPAPVERKKDWRDDRIAKLTGRLRELNERQPAQAPVAAASAAPLDPTADFNQRVAAEAQKYGRQIAEAEKFNTRCTEEAAKGRKTWKDFDDRLNDLRSLVNVADENEVAQYNSFLQAGLETGELALLVYELGQDLDEANKIMQLPPLKMGVELTKRALKGAQIEEISRVPKPLAPLTGGRGEQVPIDPTNPELADNLSTADWMKRREKQVAERNANR